MKADFNHADNRELQIQLTKAQKVGLQSSWPSQPCVAAYACPSNCADKLAAHSLRLWLQGETWESALEGHSLQVTAKDADQKRLLLERFQHEARHLLFATQREERHLLTQLYSLQPKLRR